MIGKSLGRANSLLSILFFLFISLAIALLFFGQSFSVVADSTNATGGYITYLNLSVEQQTAHWTGFFGQFLFAPQGQAPTAKAAEGGNVSLQNFNFTTTCANPTNISGVMMFTNSSSLPTGLVPGNLTVLDNLVPGFSDSPSNTFTKNASYIIGGNTINNVPTTYTYINSSPQNISFKEGYLQDSGGNLVFASVIEENVPGFNLTAYDFQMMVPVLNYGPTSYNVFADFTYSCALNDTYERLVFPDGLFELLGIYNKSVTLQKFGVQFIDLTLSVNNTIECIAYTANSSQTRTLNYTTPVKISNQNITINYTILTGDPDGNVLTSWFINNCSIIDNTGTYLNVTNVTNQPVYVKTSPWYRISVGEQIGFDVANAYSAYKFNQRAYFGHNDTTQQDVNFAFRKLIGTFSFEGICNDGLDNDNDGNADGADSDCQALFFNVSGHQLNQGAGGFGTFSFVSPYLGPSFGTQSSPPSPCTGNICSFTVGTGANQVTVQYTQRNKPGGRFKVKYYNPSISNKITFMTVSSVGSPSLTFGNSTTSLFNLSGTGLPYKIMLPDTGPPFSRVQANSRPDVTSSQTFTGTLNQVTNTTLAGVAINNYTINFDAFIGSGVGDVNFTIYVDSVDPTNDFERDPKLARGNSSTLSGTQKNTDNSCNDNIDNDLAFDNVDCRDSDCDTEAIGVSLGGDVIKCEFGVETTCYDGYDNDGDGSVDCADSDCTGRIGAYINSATSLPEKKYIAGANYSACEGSNEGALNYSEVPSSCDDRFDNDADNNAYLSSGYSCGGTAMTDCRGKAIDCYDSYSCWGRGNLSTVLSCPLFENVSGYASCNDSLDNDYDVDIGSNWLGITVPDPGLDSSGADCDDYDCYGAPNCPVNETAVGGALACFDGIDNDLDKYVWSGTNYVIRTGGGTDCDDPDCDNVTNPITGRVCRNVEFLRDSYNLCYDTVDDDYDNANPDGTPSCRDNRKDVNTTATSISNLTGTDCWARFRDCQPCPAHENISAFSCADNSDNDYDDGSGTYETGSGGRDCADSDCVGEFGDKKGAVCTAAGGESTTTLCSDGFDNDNDGSIDCADSNCVGVSVPGGTCAVENTAGTCNNDFDDDNDGRIDCVDSGCNGVGVCASSPTFGSLTTIPTYASSSVENGDINFVYTTRVHRGKPSSDNFTIVFSSASGINHGTGIVQIVLGTSLNNVTFIYNESLVSLSGASAGDFNCPVCVDVTDGVLNLQDNNSDGLALNGGILSLTVTIRVPHDVALGTETFPVSSNTACASGCGVSNPQTKSITIYESTVPRIQEIEVEPTSGPQQVEVGSSVSIRAIANDTLPSGGLTDSNIYACRFSMAGSISTETDCVYSPTFNADGTFTIYMNSTDTVGNIGATNSTTITVDVQPKDTTSNFDLVSHYFSSSLTILDIGTFSFQTGSTDTFSTTCNVIIENSAFAPIFIDSSSITNDGSFSTSCSGSIALPASVYNNDGVYFVRVNVTDSDGVTVSSARKTFYVCNNLNSAGSKYDCSKADFDNDGYTEGVISIFTYTDPTTNVTTNLTCDSCPGVVNIGRDYDGDGYDDACDPPAGVGVYECSDGIDNDNDGYIDYPDDYDCDSPTDPTESGGAKQPRDDGHGTPGYDPTYTSYKGLLSRWLEEEKEPEPAKPAKPGKPGKPAKPAKPAVPPKVAIKPVEEGPPKAPFAWLSLLALLLRVILFIIVFSFAQKDSKMYKKLVKSLHKL